MHAIGFLVPHLAPDRFRAVVEPVACMHGDGTTIAETDPITTHAYAAAGNHTVALTVTDSDGFDGTTTQVITIVSAREPLPSALVLFGIAFVIVFAIAGTILFVVYRKAHAP